MRYVNINIISLVSWHGMLCSFVDD